MPFAVLPAGDGHRDAFALPGRGGGVAAGEMAARQSGHPVPEPAAMHPILPSRRAEPFRPAPSAASSMLAGVPGLALAAGFALVATVPAARAFSETFGWMPLWLLGMPASACLVACLQRARAMASSTLARESAGVARTRRAPAVTARRARNARRMPGRSRAA